jgi:hypothetical protein
MSKLLLHSAVTTLRQCSGCVQEIKHDEPYIGCKSRTAVAWTANLDHTHIKKVEVSRQQQQQQEWILSVDFYHHHNKKLFLSAFKAHGPLFLCQIINEQIDAPIYIREELTPYYNKLAYEARKVKKGTRRAI